MAYCGNFGRNVAQRGSQTSADFSLNQACKLQSHFLEIHSLGQYLYINTK